MSSFRSADQEYYSNRYRNRADRWSNREETSAVSSGLKEILSKTAIESKPLTLLDIGCGRMPVTFPLLHKFSNLRILGIDWALNEVLTAYPDFEYQITAIQHISVISADFMSFRCIPRFNVAVDLGTFHHIAPFDWRKYTEQLSRLIRDDSHFLLESFHPDDANWHKRESGGHSRKGYYCHYHDVNSIKEIFGKLFTGIQELLRPQNWEHVTAIYHMSNADKAIPSPHHRA